MFAAGHCKWLCVALAALLVVPASGVSASAAWPMFKGDAQHTGQSLFNGSEENTLRWHFPTGQRIHGSPAVGPDGTVYIGSFDGYLYAIKPDGTEKWKFNANSFIESSPAIGPDGTIYVGSWDNNLYVVSPDGEAIGRADTHERVTSSPTVGPDGTVYIGNNMGILYALKGELVAWGFKTGSRIISSAAVGPDGTVYVGSFDNKTYAINPDGTEKWNFKTLDVVFSSPAIGQDGTIYVGSFDKNLYAINPDGTEKWRFTAGDYVQASPSIAKDGTIYVGSFDKNLYAINPDGTEKWRFTAGDLIASSATIDADGTIFFGSADRYLYAINPDGTEKWRFEAKSRIFSSPAIGPDGTIYVGSVDNNLYAIGEQLISSTSKLPAVGATAQSVGYADVELYVTAAEAEKNDDGTRSVTASVMLKNNGKEPRSFDIASFKLKDLSGIEHPTNPEKSKLKNVRIQVGDTVRGTIVFDLPEGVVTDLLIYHDNKGIRLTVNLTQVKMPPDAEPSSIFVPGPNVAKKLVGRNLEVTILDEKFLDTNPPQYAATISIQNLSSKTVTYDAAYAYVKDTDGYVYTAGGDFKGELEPGKAAKGEIRFAVQHGVESVIFVYDDTATETYFIVPEFALPPVLFMVASVSVAMMLAIYRMRTRNLF